MSFNKPEVRESVQPEDEVSGRADLLVREAGEAVVEAMDGLEEPKITEDESSPRTSVTKDGKIIEADSMDWGGSFGGKTDTVKVSRKPSFFQRVFRRAPKESTSHSIRTDAEGRVVHTTVRPSVLGGRVEKRATTYVNEDGTKSVSYDVTRYDEDGNEVIRGDRNARYSSVFGRHAHQTTSDQVAGQKRREAEINSGDYDPEYKEELRQRERDRREKDRAEEKAVLDTASAIAGRVDRALSGEGSMEPQEGYVPDKEVTPRYTSPEDHKRTNGGNKPKGPVIPGYADTRSHKKTGSVPQVPKAASKYAAGYQAKRRAEQKALEEDPTTIEHAAANDWDL